MPKMRVALFLAMVALVWSAGSVFAAYPERPIKLIVPWAAGGDTDVIYRAFVPFFQKHLGQTVVIANVGGASGTVGEREAANAPPDGYTIYAPHDYVHSVYYAGMTDIRYDQAFEPICLVASTPSIITASPKTPWGTIKEFIEDAKKRPGQITAGASLGSTSQFALALMEKSTGIKMKYVPYDGTAQRMNALLGGHVDIAESNLTQKAKADAGQLKFLAIMTAKRNAEVPNVPTLKELGYDVQYAVNRGIMVPKGTPADVKAKLGSACAAAAKAPEFAKAMTLQGTEVRYLDAKEYTAFLTKVDRETKEVTRDLGMLKRE
jgi:tripartite-type tricarboxylate transporter receptor subunit TctC